MNVARTSTRLLRHVFLSAMVAFLLMPVLAVVPASLTRYSFITLPPDQVSLRWYSVFFADLDWVRSFITSFEVAIIATALSVTLGMLAAIGLERCSSRIRSLVLGLILSPLIVPVIMTAISLYYVGRLIGTHGTVLGMALGHTIMCLPFAVINIGVSLKALDRTLLRAAEGMGAGPWRVFRTVTVPIVFPGLAGGAAFAFITSFDEVVISIFLAGVRVKTLPVKMWETIRVEFTPVTAVASVLLVGLTLIMFIIIQWFRYRQCSRRSA